MNPQQTERAIKRIIEAGDKWDMRNGFTAVVQPVAPPPIRVVKTGITAMLKAEAKTIMRREEAAQPRPPRFKQAPWDFGQWLEGRKVK